MLTFLYRSSVWSVLYLSSLCLAFLPEDPSVTLATSQASGSAGFLISWGLWQLSLSCVGQEHVCQLDCDYSQRVTAQSTWKSLGSNHWCPLGPLGPHCLGIRWNNTPFCCVPSATAWTTVLKMCRERNIVKIKQIFHSDSIWTYLEFLIFITSLYIPFAEISISKLNLPQQKASCFSSPGMLYKPSPMEPYNGVTSCCQDWGLQVYLCFEEGLIMKKKHLVVLAY